MEMNAEQLWETTMNPEVRTLIQLDVTDDESFTELIDKLMNSKRADDRKEWLVEEVDFEDD